MAINQISTANTFEQWLIATQSLIAFANSVTDNVFVANTITANLVTAVNINTTSDESLKNNMIRITNSLDILEKITGLSFNWKSDGVKSYGVSAQEIEKILPEIVITRDDGIKGVNYLNLIAFLVEAVKDLKKDLSEIKTHINIK